MNLLFSKKDILVSLPFFIPAILGSSPFIKNVMSKFEERPGVAEVLHDVYLVAVLSISVIFLFGETFNPFIYFRF